MAVIKVIPVTVRLFNLSTGNNCVHLFPEVLKAMEGCCVCSVSTDGSRGNPKTLNHTLSRVIMCNLLPQSCAHSPQPPFLQIIRHCINERCGDERRWFCLTLSGCQLFLTILWSWKKKPKIYFKNMVKSLSGFGEIVVEACGRAT